MELSSDEDDSAARRKSYAAARAAGAPKKGIIGKLGKCACLNVYSVAYPMVCHVLLWFCESCECLLGQKITWVLAHHRELHKNIQHNIVNDRKGNTVVNEKAFG